MWDNWRIQVEDCRLELLLPLNPNAQFQKKMNTRIHSSVLVRLHQLSLNLSSLVTQMKNWMREKKTLQRIRERTRLPMQNPKARMKLANLGHAQSQETREKIITGVRMGWERRREKLMVQETCHFEWMNLITEASRKGYFGEEELQ
ncbi:hypothetical protein V6N11_061266 [Hibiscus sabdariffa]|uniref:Uncharacterized protein n=1 Tax=Hibiscus sabdariffa TaxID=183260 RepID=A0ABR2NVA9_9ROSI